ncbi:peptide/nickel transport system substrate-binding protein [Devosia crocina]|uniref:Peptide/nickel transport system substrate-binding protein n=1 Tax=Devosia crocina TaxID=429728 RepID=A0A1I7MXR2_9HYPH|nr:ABC transporter substrate-binding protein [Devosia crocina]SFV27158.1 peptide/nickel transport system substrate-binding protein [Devosia crocina]
MLTIALEKLDFLPANRVTDDTSILTLKNLVFEPLLRWQPGGRVAPALFSHWSHSADGRHWSFTIRPGATFHDGVDCTADHVMAFIEGILNSVDMFGMKWSYSRYLAQARISAPSRDVIEVDNPEPLADILDIFSEFFICRQDSQGRAVLGTGPYRVTAFTPGQFARLDAVAGGRSIEVQCVPSAEERYAKLKAGQIDAALNLERLDEPVTFDPQFQWGKAVNTLSVMYYLNCSTGLFTAPQARLAANHAIDKKSLIAEIFQGLGAEASTIVSPFHLGMAEPIAPIAYDPDAAKRLLDAAGGPSAITLRTPLYMPERAPRISQFVAAALEAIGLSVTIDTETDRPDYARQVGRKAMGDMAIFDSSPQSTFRVLDDKISARNQAVWWQGFDDPETESLIAAANRAVHDDDRERAYGATLRRLNANPPWLYLFHPTDIFAARAGLGGLGIDHKGILTIQ